jgi:hypothetical protein
LVHAGIAEPTDLHRSQAMVRFATELGVSVRAVENALCEACRKDKKHGARVAVPVPVLV